MQDSTIHSVEKEIWSMAQRAYSHGVSLDEFLRNAKSAFVQVALERSGGNKTVAGRLIGISRHSVRKAVRG